MAYELWATYSVKDHLEPRRLAADLMLFDRLVFPVPEQGRFPPNSGSPVDIGPVEWVRDEVEWARWELQAWEPEAQQQLLEWLGPAVRKVSWSGAGLVRERYRAEAARLASMNVPDYAFVATRTAMTRDLPAYVEGVAAIGPSYRSFVDFEKECATGPLDQARDLPGSMLTVVLGAEFLTPDPEDDRTTELLLRETAEFVSGNAKFRSSRAAFHEWQRKFLNPEDRTDAASVKRAVEEMRDLVAAANAAAGQLKIRKTIRNVFRLAPIGLGLASAFAGGGLVFAVSGACISLGSFAIDEKLFKSSEQGQPPPAAFVRDARRHFGWKD
ncbi:hypothetical protein [Reyranella sp.]|uniref:hypothetical protein n=1 Tax=Reyranella sp. TaxID=1929291 RepID=UPI003D09FFB1